jgi:ERCC4-type nuclease
VEYLKGQSYQVMVRQVPTGDFIWQVEGGRAGCEAKTVRDLVDSAQSGRLDEQLFRLQRNFTVAILFVVGLATPLDVPDIGGWTYNGIDNLLVGRNRRGILTSRCASEEPAEVGDRLNSLIRYTRKAPRRALRPRHYPISGRLSDRAEVVHALLSSVRGVRDKSRIAERLAAGSSLADIFSFTDADWRERGFTKLMASRLADRCKEEGV